MKYLMIGFMLFGLIACDEKERVPPKETNESVDVIPLNSWDATPGIIVQM